MIMLGNMLFARLSKFNLAIDDSNRQQALFPETSTIFPNENGTALGCHIQWKNRHIFMLPGPPSECYPIFESQVLPILDASNFFQKKKVYRWLTLGLIEGETSSALDEIVKPYSCKTAYRWVYPYLEIKIISKEKVIDETLISKVEDVIKPYLVSNNGVDAYAMLATALSSFAEKIYISGGDEVESFINELGHPNLLFLSESKHEQLPDTRFHLNISFSAKMEASSVIHLESLGYRKNNVAYEHSMLVPNRGAEITLFINNYLAWQIYQFSKSQGWVQ